MQIRYTSWRDIYAFAVILSDNLNATVRFVFTFISKSLVCIRGDCGLATLEGNICAVQPYRW